MIDPPAWQAQDTPLHEAATEGLDDVVKELLAAGADASVCNRFGWSPIHSAIINQHSKVVQALLQQGCVDPNLQDPVRSGLKETMCDPSCSELPES